MTCLLKYFFVLIILGLFQTGCDLREGTIVYDVEFPRADSDEAQGGGGGGSGSGGSGGTPTVTLSTSAANIAENSGTVTVTGTLSSSASTDALIGLGISGSGTRNTDFSIDNATLVIAAGSTTGTRTLTGIDDSIDDDGETIIIDIDNVTGGDSATESATQQVTVTITDDDGAPNVTLTASASSVAEAAASITLTATLSNLADNTTNIGLVTSGNATLTSDYTIASTNLSIAAGASTATTTITSVQDTVDEFGEVVRIDIDNVTGSTAVESGDQFVSISITDDDVSTPSIAVTPSTQQNTISWSAIPGADNYTLYWRTSAGVSASDSSFVISSGSTTWYVHSGLNAGTTYYYKLMATDGLDSSALSAEASGQPTAFAGCSTSGTLTDNDTDLLVHYAFENNLNDIAGSGSTGSPYNLSNPGGTIKYAQSCAYGQAAYFDSSTGYLENSNFNRTNIISLDSGNYTIALWVNRDADMIEYASAISSKDTTNSVSTWGDSIQIDVDEIGGNNYMRWNNAPSTGIADQAMITDGTSLTDWSYITAVHYDNDTAQFYRNGVLVGTHTTFPARWYKMKVGINRGGYVGNQHGLGLVWKGYIDEVKVYGRALTSIEVVDKCLAYSQCDNLTPNIPLNLTATAGVSQVTVAWDNVTGADNYTVYWTDTPSTAIDPANAATYDGTKTVSSLTTVVTGLTNGTSYDFAVKATNSAGSSAVSDEANATPLAAPVVTLSGTASVTEGNSGATNATITATLDRTASTNTTVTLTASGTATGSGTDYTLSSSTITITAGNTTGTATVSVVGETTAEDNETVILDITGVSGGDSATESGTPQQVTVTIIDDDLAAPVLDNATPAEQQNTIYWQAYSNASSYTLYWKTSSGVSTSDDNITISDNSSTSYIHGGLDNGTTYYYKLVANTASGSSALSNEVSGVPTAYDSCTTSGILADNDTDLLVYYPFNGNLNDEKNSHGDGRYNLTNSGGTIRFPQGCSYGLAGYFNTTSGYAYNDNFTDSNVGGALAAGNYTITMWVNADADMPKFASALNTGFKNQMSPTGWQNKSQIDIDGNGRIEWLTANNSGSNNDITGSSSFPLHQWHHLAAVHYDNDTAQLYSNGTLLESTNSFPAKWYGLVVGVNRANNPETRTWKGYIDEVKVYGRPFSYNDVIEKCGAYAECLVPPANLAATAAAYQNTLSWTAVNGASGYKIYWDTNANVTTSDSSITISDNSSTSYVHSSLTAGQTYYYRIVTIKDSESALSNEVSGTTPPPPSAVSNLAATSGYQQVKLTWSNVAGADNYTLFWALNDPFTSPFTVTNGSNSIEGVSSGFIHGGLTSGKRYEYALQVVDNGVSSALSNQVNGTPTGETTVTLPADNNTDLVVYYDFDGDLNNKASTGAAYNLTAAGDAGFVYAGSRFTGDQASYFDSRGGYAYNDNFTDNGSGRVSAYGIPELQDNFTVSMWLRPDEDMSTYASALTSSDGTGGSSSGRFQISDNGSGGIVAITNNRDKWQTNAQLTLNSWSHVVAVKYDNGTLRMYKDGTAGANEVFIATSFNPLALRPASDNETSFTTEWHKIKIGINRVSQSPWKGYVDEVKIYKKSLTPTEVGYLYNNHCPKVSCP